MNTKDLINWGALSRVLSGSRQTVRRNSVPKVHQPIVDELLHAVDAVLSKWADTAKAGGEKENKTGNTDEVD